MNFHSILVHFPIALLTIYSLFELARFRFLRQQKNWFYIKASFLITGTIMAFPALSTGGMLEDLPQYNRQLLGLHESFASVTTNFYLVIAIAYILAIAYRSAKIKNYLFSLEVISKQWKRAINTLFRICNEIIESKVFFLVPVVGIVLLSITGGLGGVLSRGLGVDPVADFIYRLFF